MSNFPEEEKSLLTVKDVASRLQVSERTIWRWRAADRLPRPICLSPRSIRWRIRDINEYLGCL